MTDERTAADRAVADILNGVVKKTVLLVLIAAAGVLVFTISTATGGVGQAWFIPLSMGAGALLGLVNFRWLTTAVQRIYLRKGATPGISNLAAAIINFLKLAAIFVVLFIIIKWRLLHVFGLVGGLSLCFLAILWQGLALVKEASSRAE